MSKPPQKRNDPPAHAEKASGTVDTPGSEVEEDLFDAEGTQGYTDLAGPPKRRKRKKSSASLNPPSSQQSAAPRRSSLPPQSDARSGAKSTVAGSHRLSEKPRPSTQLSSQPTTEEIDLRQVEMLREPVAQKPFFPEPDEPRHNDDIHPTFQAPVDVASAQTRDPRAFAEDDPLEAEPTQTKQVGEARKRNTTGTASMESRSKLGAEDWSDLEHDDQLMPSIRGDDFDAFSPSLAGAPERKPGTLSGERISTLTGRLPIGPNDRMDGNKGGSTPPRGEARLEPSSERPSSEPAPKPRIDIWGEAPKRPIRAKPRESRVSEGPPGFIEDTVRHLGKIAGLAGTSVKAGTHQLSAQFGRAYLFVMMAGGALSVLVVIGIWLLLSHFQTESNIEAKLAEGLGGGSYSALKQAVRLQKEDDSQRSSKRARLELSLAVLTLDHGSPAEGTPPDMLASVDKELLDDPQMQVALIYRSLATGNMPFAKKTALRLYRTSDEDGPRAEVFRARALVAQTSRNLDRALGDARSAVGEYESSPRHLALLATLQAQTGKTQLGLKTLDSAKPRDSAVVQVTRGMIHWSYERSHRAAAKAVGGLVNDTRRGISPAYKTTAHTLTALHKLRTLNTPQAHKHARIAENLMPESQVDARLLLASVWLELGESERADKLLGQIPSSKVFAARTRLLKAKVALLRGDIEKAENTLLSATQSPETDLLRAAMFQAKGELDLARGILKPHTKDSMFGLEASSQLALIELEAGEPRKTIALLKTWSRKISEEPQLAALLARAYGQTGDLKRASKTLSASLSTYPDAFELSFAKALIDIQRGRGKGAMDMLRKLATKRPGSVNVQVALGKAALQAGKLEEAERALKTALQKRPGDEDATSALAEVYLAKGNVEGAKGILAELPADIVEQRPILRRGFGKILVLQGQGLEAAEYLESDPTLGNDAELQTFLGRAWMQAEEDNKAKRAFENALSLGDIPWAHIGIAIVDLRNGRFGGVSSHLDALDHMGATKKTEYKSLKLAVQARLKFEFGDLAKAEKLAKQAISLDGKNAQAHLVMANILEERDKNALEELAAASRGTAPPPEAVGRLAIKTEEGADACKLARRYLSAAPKGYDASAVKKILADCP